MSELLRIHNLRIHFHNAAPDRFAVNGLTLSIQKGEILGLVGESGCGKTVTAMSISGLLPRRSCDVEGSILLEDREILQCPQQELLDLQGDEISVVFQEPMTSMNPTMKIGPQIEESLRAHTKLSKAERKAKALKAMEDVELKDPDVLYHKYPHELSGGMLQRVMIAAAIINDPILLLADEPTTALDVTIQAQILELLKKLNHEKGMSILMISHNLQVVRKLCTHVAVMQRGKLVEEGNVEEIFRNPRQEYTRTLINAIPTRNTKLRKNSDET